MKPRLLIILVIFQLNICTSYSQACAPLGDQTSFGTGNIWIGYVYDNLNFIGYNGYVNEGNAGSPNFDENFGGDYVNYLTNGCATYTETFTVRYKLTKNFANGDYEFTVGADDGYRLSLDGGVTWIINNWNDQSYTTTTYSVHLNGNYSMVLEYYENGGGNRVSFNLQATCLGTGDPAIYGTGNIWNGYVYDGTNFNTYKGLVNEGAASNPNFDENFGGSNTSYSTNTCATQTETFSVRYRLRKNFASANYIFIVGGDDGYRLSLDGGATWVIDRWSDQSYNTSSYSASISGSHDMVIEYYENGGENRISFSLSGAILPIQLISFEGQRIQDKVMLNWTTTANSTTDHFEIERSSDNNQFSNISKVTPSAGTIRNEEIKFTYTDNTPGISNSYYRLKMIDISGTATYSKIISIPGNYADHGIQVYPTISNGNFSILSSDKIINPSVSLYDLSGNKVAGKKLPAIAARTSIPVSLLNIIVKGIYILRVSDGDSVLATQKIILE